MNTYNERHAHLVQDLINTYDLYLEQPEHILQPSDLDRFLAQHGIHHTNITDADLEAVCELREQLRTSWNARNLTEVLASLNPFLGQAALTVQAETEDNQAFHLKFSPPADTPIVQRLALACALGMLGVLQQYGLDRMQACAASPCQDVFIDTSRNNSKRFCSEQCANRYNIAAYRERQEDKI